MKRIILTIFLVVMVQCFIRAQSTGSFTVKGDASKFYPVTFKDGNWNNNMPTELQLGRSSTHLNEDWRGSLMAKFTFHTSLYGNGSGFINAEIIQLFNGYNQADKTFIAGYRDGSVYNGSSDFIFWLRGNSTYFYKSNVAQSPVMYDGVQNPLPFREENGPAHTFKTTVDGNINSFGETLAGTIYSLGGGTNVMSGNLGLGTSDTKGFKLAVNGNIRAKEIKVETASWPDYVFEENYASPSLAEIENYIKVHKHLPEIPSAEEVKAANGVSLGEMNNKLLKKMEEMTLHMIEMNKRLNVLNDQVSEQKSQLIKQRNQINKIEAVKR